MVFAEDTLEKNTRRRRRSEIVGLNGLIRLVWVQVFDGKHLR
jgi:hypothetical protein